MMFFVLFIYYSDNNTELPTKAYKSIFAIILDKFFSHEAQFFISFENPHNAHLDKVKV